MQPELLSHSRRLVKKIKIYYKNKLSLRYMASKLSIFSHFISFTARFVRQMMTAVNSNEMKIDYLRR